MGCGASKVVDDNQALVKKSLVKKCRERKRLMKNAVDYRYELSNSHVAYFHSLKDMGHALSRFVDEQLDIPPSSAPDDDDDDAVVKSMPPSGSDSISSSDFHGHDNNGHIRIHDDDDDDHLHEVFKEIKDEFKAAFSYGKQVALMLEAGKLPYQSKFHVLKGILSKILGPLAPSSTTSSSRSRVTELAGSYNVYDVPDNRSLNLSSTLEKLYMWEKKLYKEVKDAKRLRVMYQRMLKRLTELEPCRPNSSQIHAAQASIERLRTKLDISMKLIDAISSEIHQVRDMELQPQVRKLIYGLIGMWQSVGKCHRKQLEAIKESRSLTLRANTSMERDSGSGTTLELETRLVTWAQHFNSWINAQKSFVDSLNGWLLQFNIDHEPEINTDGGEVPYSPGRSGAPPIFIICNDWQRQLKGVSQERVSIAMNKFAVKLRQLLEREDEIQRLSKSQVDMDHKKAMKLVKNVGAGSLQGGLIPIFKALENFSRDVFKAHKHVRLQ